MTIGELISLRAKVMHGLECCSALGKSCRKNCPYGEECFETDGEGITHLCSDALELIKEQQKEIKLLRENAYYLVNGEWE